MYRDARESRSTDTASFAFVVKRSDLSFYDYVCALVRAHYKIISEENENFNEASFLTVFLNDHVVKNSPINGSHFKGSEIIHETHSF
jgi:hypothetical protein